MYSSPTWTMFSSDHLWALLSTPRTEQPISTTEGGWRLLPLPAHPSHVDEKQEEVGWTAPQQQHSAAQNNCALSFLPLTLETPHIRSTCLR